MTDLIEHLITALRNELKEYGEMLALLQEQQEHLMSRRIDGVLASVERINSQTLVIRRCRAGRRDAQRLLAESVAPSAPDTLPGLIPHLPPEYAPLLEALTTENRRLLAQVQQCGRQNFLMLNRAVELMQQFLGSLSPGQNLFSSYAGNGSLARPAPSTLMYEAIG